MGGQDLQLREGSGRFQTNLSKNFANGAHFQFYDHDYLKELIIVKFLIRKQSPVELFP